MGPAMRCRRPIPFRLAAGPPMCGRCSGPETGRRAHERRAGWAPGAVGGFPSGEGAPGHDRLAGRASGAAGWAGGCGIPPGMSGRTRRISALSGRTIRQGAGTVGGGLWSEGAVHLRSGPLCPAQAWGGGHTGRPGPAGGGLRRSGPRGAGHPGVFLRRDRVRPGQPSAETAGPSGMHRLPVRRDRAWRRIFGL